MSEFGCRTCSGGAKILSDDGILIDCPTCKGTGGYTKHCDRCSGGCKILLPGKDDEDVLSDCPKCKGTGSIPN